MGTVDPADVRVHAKGGGVTCPACIQAASRSQPFTRTARWCCWQWPRALRRPAGCLREGAKSYAKDSDRYRFADFSEALADDSVAAAL